MGKAVLEAFVSLVLLVVVLGAIIWDLHKHSDQMVVEADHLETLIDQQRESYAIHSTSTPTRPTWPPLPLSYGTSRTTVPQV